MPSNHRVAPLARLTVAWTTLALVLAASGRVDAQAPTPLSAYVPGDEVAVYLEFQGLDAHADAWKRSSAYKILNDTPTGAMLDEVAVQFLTQKMPPKSKITGAEAVILAKHLVRHGFIYAGLGKAANPQSQREVFVARGVFKNKETRPIVARLLSSVADPTKPKPKVVEVAGHKIVVQTVVTGKVMAYWVDDVRKEDLVLVPPQTTEADVVRVAGSIFSTIEAKTPNATNHPSRVALAKDEDGFGPVAFAFVDFTAMGPIPAPPELGLETLKTVDMRWGFQDKETVSILRVVAPKPRQGLLALFDQPTFEKGVLPPIPEGVTGFSVFTFSPKTFYDQVTTLAKSINPQAGAQIDAISDQIKAKTRLRLKEDILSHLGPKMAVYVAPSPKASADASKAPAFNPLAAMLGGAEIPRLTLIADIDDPVAFGRVLDELMIQVNQALKTAGPPTPPPDGGAPRSTAKGAKGPSSGIEFKLVPGATKVFMLTMPPTLSALVPSYIKPTIRVGPKHVVFSISPDSARQALEVKGGSVALTTYAATLQPAPANLLVAIVADPTETLPAALASFPGALQAKINQANAPPAAMPATNGPGGPGGPPGAMTPGGFPGSSSSAPGAMIPGSSSGSSSSIPPGSSSGSRPPESSGGPGPNGADAKPADGSVIFNIDAAKLPTAASIKPFVIPSLFTVSVDDDGIKVISREAFPDLGSLVSNNSLGSILEKARASMLGMPNMGGPLPAGPGAPPASVPGAGTPKAAQRGESRD